MSKKSKSQKKASAKHVRRGLTKTAVITIAICVAATGAALSRWEPVRRTLGLSPTLTSSPPQSGTPSSAKEYIYAGGRLIATEEPVTSPGGPSPTNLVATATSATNVSLTWTPPTTGTITNYVVERSQSLNGSYTTLSPNPTSNAFTDNTAAGDTAYLYRVRATFSAGGASEYSNRDLATTVMFTDNSLAGIPIQAIHLTELRRAVNAVRALVAGLGPASWTYPDPVSSPQSQRRGIYLEDVTELRSRLDEALGPLGLQTSYPAQPPLARGSVVSAAHFEQIRDRMR